MGFEGGMATAEPMTLKQIGSCDWSRVKEPGEKKGEQLLGGVSFVSPVLTPVAKLLIQRNGPFFEDARATSRAQDASGDEPAPSRSVPSATPLANDHAPSPE